MADLIFIAVVIGFFAVAAAFIRGCERIIGGASPGDERHGR